MPTPGYPQGLSVEYASRHQQEIGKPVQYGRSAGTGLGTEIALSTQLQATGVVNRVGTEVTLDPTRWPTDGQFRLRATGRTSGPAIAGLLYLQTIDGQVISGTQLEFSGVNSQTETSGILQVRNELGYVRPYAAIYEVILELSGGVLITDTVTIGQVSWLID